MPCAKPTYLLILPTRARLAFPTLWPFCTTTESESVASALSRSNCSTGYPRWDKTRVTIHTLMYSPFLLWVLIPLFCDGQFERQMTPFCAKCPRQRSCPQSSVQRKSRAGNLCVWEMFGSASLLRQYGLNVVKVEPACKVQGCKVILDVRSIFSWSQSESAYCVKTWIECHPASKVNFLLTHCWPYKRAPVQLRIWEVKKGIGQNM